MSNCYLLGAGFSHAISDGKLPLLSGLGEELSPLIDEKLKQKYNYSPEGLETFITHLDLKIKSEPSSEEADIRKKIENFLVKKFTIKNFKEFVTPLALKFVESTLENNDNIITTNYDCLLDHIMSGFGIWTPNGGYSDFVLNSAIGDNVPTNNSLRNITLLKVHGSSNFIEHYGVDKTGEKVLDHTFIGFQYDVETFPSLHMNVGFALPERQYIIGPSYVKAIHPQLLQLWKLAFNKTSNIANLILIGTSLRDEDNFLLLLLSNINCQKLIVVDPNYDNIIKKMFKIAPKATESTKYIVMESVEEFLAWKAHSDKESRSDG